MECATRVITSGIDTGKVELYTADKIHYSPSEIAEIKRNGGEMTAEIHNIKKAFSVFGEGGKNDFARIVITP